MVFKQAKWLFRASLVELPFLILKLYFLILWWSDSCGEEAGEQVRSDSSGELVIDGSCEEHFLAPSL